MERKAGRYKVKPNPPKDLNKVGNQYWDLYCYFLLERGVLEGYIIPTLENLVFYEQERVEIQNKLANRSGDEDLHKTLNTVVTKIRQLKDDLGIYVRKNEMSKPDSVRAEKEKNEGKKEAKISLLKSKPN